MLKLAEIVFDKFHVLQHASAALDEVRRQEFFRAGPVMREHGRGKRWLLLRRWKTVRGSKRAELPALFAANRRLFKAYVLREQLDRLWTYKTREGVLNFVMVWFKALRWQRLPEMERLGDFLLKHINGIVAYCDHAVRFGVVEAINTTIKAVLRRARGMRDEEMLLLKLKWATAHPIRSARDLVRFLTAQPLLLKSVKTDKVTCYKLQVQSLGAVRSHEGITRIGADYAEMSMRRFRGLRRGNVIDMWKPTWTAFSIIAAATMPLAARWCSSAFLASA